MALIIVDEKMASDVILNGCCRMLSSGKACWSLIHKTIFFTLELKVKVKLMPESKGVPSLNYWVLDILVPLVIFTSLCPDDFWNYQSAAKIKTENCSFYHNFLFQSTN